MASWIRVVSLLTEVGRASGRAGAVAGAVVHRGKFATAAHHEALAGLLKVLVRAVDLYSHCQRCLGVKSLANRQVVAQQASKKLLTIELVREGIFVLCLRCAGSYSNQSHGCVCY